MDKKIKILILFLSIIIVLGGISVVLLSTKDDSSSENSVFNSDIGSDNLSQAKEKKIEDYILAKKESFDIGEVEKALMSMGEYSSISEFMGSAEDEYIKISADNLTYDSLSVIKLKKAIEDDWTSIYPSLVKAYNNLQNLTFVDVDGELYRFYATKVDFVHKKESLPIMDINYSGLIFDEKGEVLKYSYGDNVIARAMLHASREGEMIKLSSKNDYANSIVEPVLMSLIFKDIEEKFRDSGEDFNESNLKIEINKDVVDNNRNIIKFIIKDYGSVEAFIEKRGDVFKVNFINKEEVLL